MTQLMGRPILELPNELGTRTVTADLLAGVRTALLGLALVGVPVLGLWVATPHADADAAGAARAAGALWLLGHGAPMLRADVAAPVTVTPLLLGLFVVGRLYRAGARAGAAGASVAGAGPRRAVAVSVLTLPPSARARWRGPAAVCAGYWAVAVAVVAQCSQAGADGGLQARVLPDLLVIAVLAAVATAAGARAARRPGAAPVRPPSDRRPDPDRPVPPDRPVTADRLPAWARPPAWALPDGGGPAVRAAVLAALSGLLAAGALVLAVAAVVDAADGAGPASAALHGGPAAVLGLLLLSLVLLPNAVLWAAAYALGPGFAAGTGTSVGPAGAVLGPLPEFPLFGLVAEPGTGGWRLAACLLPVLAAVVPALLLGRAAAGGTTRREPWRPPATVLAVLAAAVLAGAVAAVAGWLAGGALAGGRMARLGPSPWRTGLAAAGWLAVVGVPVALGARAAALGAVAGASAWPLRCVHLGRRGVHAAVLRLCGLLGGAG